MDHNINGDNLHRLMKQALDDGSAKSVEDAIRLFEGYRLSVSIASEQANDPIGQMILLTVVALASRVFLGGVQVSGDLNVSLKANALDSGTLSEAVVSLGGNLASETGNYPLIVIGGDQLPKRSGFAIRTAVSGWRAAICPLHADFDLQPTRPMPLTASFSAALAVNEAYLHVNGAMPIAGLRTVGASLWQPGRLENWMADDQTEPDLQYLPS